MMEISEMGIPKDLEKKGLNWPTEKLSLQGKVASELQLICYEMLKEICRRAPQKLYIW